MKIIAIGIAVIVSINVLGQEIKDPSKLPLVSYKPSIVGIDHNDRISFAYIQENGIKVIIQDKTFKVIQFDVIYACHSKSLLDFSVKRYFGDFVDPKDEYLKKRTLAGDAMDIVNTVIEKNGVRYRMKDYYFIVTKLALARRNLVPLLHAFAKDFLRVKYMFWVNQEPYFKEDVLPCFSKNP